MKPFSCPCCGKKQAFKRVLLLSNVSTWRCPKCNAILSPKPMSVYSGLIGFIGSAFPAYISLFKLGYPFWKGMLVGVAGGVVTYLLIVCYYYYYASILEKQ